MKVLITGVAGFIGSNLSQSLINQNHSVYGIDNFLTGRKENLEGFSGHVGFKFYEGDTTDFDYNQINHSFDAIFHLASPASPVQYKKYPVETLMANSLGTKRLLDFQNVSGSKTLILASTSEIYGDPLVHPQPETYWGNVNPNGERSCYDESKRFAESLASTYIRKFHSDVRIARIFNTYGPHMEKNDGRVISNFIIQALTNKPITIYGDGQQTRSFCYVSDMVAGLTALATGEKLAGEIINLGNPNERKITEIAHLIKNLTRSSSEIVNRSLPEDDPQRRKPIIDKAFKLLKWEPKVDLVSGLELTIAYFKKLIKI